MEEVARIVKDEARKSQKELDKLKADEATEKVRLALVEQIAKIATKVVWNIEEEEEAKKTQGGTRQIEDRRSW